MNFKKYLYENKKLILKIFLYTFLSVVFISVLPRLTKNIIDTYKILSMKDVIVYSFFYILSILLFLFFEYRKKTGLIEFQKKYGISVKRDLFMAITRMKHEKMNEKNSSDFINAITNDTETIYLNYIHCIIQFCISCISFFVYLMYMFFLSEILTLVIIVSCVLAFFIPKIVGNEMNKKRKILSDSKSTLIESISDLTSSGELFNDKTSSFFVDLFDRYNIDYENKSESLSKYQAFTQIFSGFSLYFINIMTFVVGIFLVYFSQTEISDLIAIIGYVDLVAIPTRDMIYQIITIKSSKKIINKLDFYFENATEERRMQQNVFSDIYIKNLDFKIGNFSLNHVNMKFEKGKKYVIIGDNGTGKSTLVKLLAGELPIPVGTVFLDDIDIASLNTQDIMHFCSKPSIFKATVDDNIKISNLDKKPDKHITNLVKDMQRKEISFSGKNLSLGQKAKLNLARALHSEKPILILDEIFANVDYQSEILLTDLLLASDKTVILVTHNRDENYLARFDKVYSL